MPDAFDAEQWPLDPVAGSDPCGEDLDLAGDADYLNFLAYVDGLLPTRYFEFDRSKVDIEGQTVLLQALKKRTRDLRLYAIEAKFRILDRDLAGFVEAVGTMTAWTVRQWEFVHPRDFEGDFGLRLAPLQSLEDPAPVLLPLQHAPLAQHRQFGPLMWRSVQLARGEVRALAGEATPDEGTIDRVMNDIELPLLIETRDLLAQLVSMLEVLQSWTADKLGFAQALRFEKLLPLSQAMLAFVDGQVARRDPAAALAGGPVPGEAVPDEGSPLQPLSPALAIDGPARARSALMAVARYFARHEPSSPALLLVSQAHRMVGRPFAEIVEMLFPAYSDDARILFGQGQMFRLALTRVVSQAGSLELPAEAEAGEEEGEPYPMPVSRGAAMALMSDVGVWFRSAQPSSPVPLILERARTMAEKDFLSLARDLLPPEALGGSS
jgi:type VI secretion system protein ImpA